MQKIVLATKNNHKLTEFRAMLENVEILSLKDIGFNEEIDETGDTLEENSKIKADAVREFLKKQNLDLPVVADDSGLFIVALDGAPGVHSARYALDHDDEGNRQEVLKNMQGVKDRTAYYECCLCYEDSDETKYFSGKTMGQITTEKIGDESFCYDCLFHSDDLNKTFGEATEKEKDSVSHRGRAVQKFKEWLAEK